MKKRDLPELVKAEWSYSLAVDSVEDKPVKLTISAGKEELNRLVQRLNILSIDSLSADLTITRIEGGRVLYVQGRIRSSLKQACVVTLDPVESKADEKFEAWFADPDQAIALAKAKHDKLAKSGSAEVPILDESEDPEPIVEGQIDLGELVTQHLSLSLHPYPHAEGVEYEYGDDEPQKVPEGFKENPFAALKDWKQKLED